MIQTPLEAWIEKWGTSLDWEAKAELREAVRQVETEQRISSLGKVETLKIETGKMCKIDAGDCGINIEGPALIICIKEKDLEESKSQNVRMLSRKYSRE